MDLTKDVLTQRNLGEDSEAWGRELENGVISVAKYQDSNSTKLANMQRAVGGGLAVTARNITELNARRIISKKSPDTTMLVTASAFPTPPIAFAVQETVAIPITDANPRKCLATISVTLYSSNPLVVADVNLYVEYKGVVVAAMQGQVPQVASRPKSDWFSSNALTFGFESYGAPPEFTFRATGTASTTSGTAQSMVGAKDILVQVTYGERV